MRKNIFGIVVILLNGHVLYGQFYNKIHIWGEVKNPGVYELPAGTDIVDLISQAGGPTEYADMNKITLTHRTIKPKIEEINLNQYLTKKDTFNLSILEDGDILRIPKNWWYKWRTFATVVAGISTVANIYYLILVTNNIKK